MKNFDVGSVVRTKLGESLRGYPKALIGLIAKILINIMGADEINAFMRENGEKKDIDFIDHLFEKLDFTYYLSNRDKLRIPSEGRIIIAANHPLGALDGLALIKAISEVRRDVKIVANDLLTSVDNLSGLFLPYDVYSGRPQKSSIRGIEESLKREEAVIIFSAAEVSRLSVKGIKDSPWHKGAVKFAGKLKAPILPVFVSARNSASFYLLSLISKKLSMFVLPREIFNKKGSAIEFKIGNIIPACVFDSGYISAKFQTKLLYKHTYGLDRNRKPIFATEQTIIHPVDKKTLKTELYKERLLGVTYDRKALFLVDGHKSPNIIKEISRLRELTFRKVGEGTGNKNDLDEYDKYYKHITLWDDDALEIAGAYRIGVGSEIMREFGEHGFYNSQAFQFTEEFSKRLINSYELGRSFIQSAYWKGSALDYLWQAIGAHVSEEDSIRYMWGAVSISDSYSNFSKALIVSYYKKWYGNSEGLATAKNQFVISKNIENDVVAILTGSDEAEDLRNLKSALNKLGHSIPVLFRKYVDLCEPGGVTFLDFNIDKEFSNTVDGLILIDLLKLKDGARERYFSQRSFIKTPVLERR